MRILFAEDDEGIRDLLSMLLRKKGHVVDAFENGADLMQQLEIDAQYDLVISDNDMPIMLGSEVLYAIKQDPRFKLIPTIVFSANDLIEAQIRAHGGIYTKKPDTKALFCVVDGLSKSSTA